MTDRKKTEQPTATSTVPVGKCPECGKPAVTAYRPFCSKRCADVDLGRWFNESYVLPGDSEIPDADGDDSLPGGR